MASSGFELANFWLVAYCLNSLCYLGSIPSTARFSEYQWVLNGVHSALVRINEELLERKVVAPV
jgi:hypothetical protein